MNTIATTPDNSSTDGSAQLNATSAAAPSAPRAEDVFCRTCGAAIRRDAAICVHCGVVTNFNATGAVRYKGGKPGTGEGKSKTVAVVMAVVFGIFSWLYTYREDAGKFWLTAAITLVNIVLSVLTLGLWLIIAFPVGLGFLAWVIIDTATKSEAWYANY